MAIVNRKPKEPLFDPNDSLGPGSYNIDDKLIFQSSPKFSIRKSQRSLPKRTIETPGPGYYDLPESYIPEKIILYNQSEGLIVVENKFPNSIFKSKTPKVDLHTTNQDTPGPGSYELSKSILQKPKYWKQQKDNSVKQDDSTVLKQILDNISYKPTVSIPSQSNTRQLFVQEDGQIKQCDLQTIHSGQLEKQSRKNKRKNINSSKSRYSAHSKQPPSPLVQNNENSGICYLTEPKNQKKIKSSLKQSSTRIIEQNNKFQLSQFTRDSEVDAQDSQYIKNAVPGPGSYETSLLSFGSKQNYKKAKNKGFGTLSKRFTEQKQDSVFGRISRQKQLKRIPRQNDKVSISFGRKPTETPKTVEQHRTLGPGSYPQTTSLSQKLLETLKKSYQGRFGSTVDRFVLDQKTQAASPDYYDINVPYLPSAANCVFKSASQRKCFGNIFKPETQKQGFYSQNSNTIEQKVKNEQAEIEELGIKKPGFHLSMVRFVDKIKKPSVQRPSDKADSCKSFSRVCANPRAYSIPCAERKPDCVKECPGPGNYNYGNLWNTRTYNVLYI